MGNEVNRRNMITLAGVGALASACSAKSLANASTPFAENFILGRDEIYGSPPGRQTPRYVANPNPVPRPPIRLPAKPTTCKNANYAPTYIAILFIDFPGGGEISVNHASFSITTNTPEGRLNQALAIIRARTTASRFSRMTESTIYERRTGAQGTDRVTFADFGFKSQCELFIYFNSPKVDLNQDWLISFTPYSAGGQPTQPNYSYANAQAVAAIGTLTGKLIRVENHLTDPYGCLLDTDTANYSMNIHFVMKLTGGGTVPMVLDPDTGNGSGYEP